MLEKVLSLFELRDSFEWRGLGEMPASARQIRPAFARHDAEARFAQSQAATRYLVGKGWQAIGLDHFALPHDEPVALIGDGVADGGGAGRVGLLDLAADHERDEIVMGDVGHAAGVDG